MKEPPFYGDWEDTLLLQFFQPDLLKETAYICSPLHADNPNQYLQNINAARAYMFYTKEHMGYLARAPHAYLPLLLSDDIAEERFMALRFGAELLERSKVILVCGNKMSPGMRGEIVQAVALHKRILVFDEDLHYDVSKIVRSNRPLTYAAELVCGHPVLANPCPQIAFGAAI